VLIELGGVRLLTDPVLRGRVAHLRRHPAPPDAGVGRGLDAVLISHLHYDHLDLPSLRRLSAPRLLAPRGAGAYLRRAGLRGVEELSPGEGVEVGGVPVTAVSAAHEGRRRPGGGPRAAPLGFVTGAEKRVYFAGDTAFFEEMASLRPLDAALLPVAGWGPKLGPGHMDAAAAAHAAAVLRPRLAVPIHWGTFHPLTVRLGAWFSDPPRSFAARLAELAPEVEARVLEPGESLALSA
jgi:L-ascorbate metabolism protein UlaG (beta-lactamase superfamily)